MKKPRKKTIIKIAGLIVVALIAFAIIKPKFTPVEVEAYKPLRKSISETITASGEVEATESASLSFSSYGTINWINVKEGDSVKRGQALASVDKNSLQESYNAAFIAYQTAGTNLDKYIQAEAEVIATYRDTQATDIINAEKAQAKQAVDAARQAVETAQTSLNIASENLKKTTIFSPIDGTVTALNIKVGEQALATSGTALVISNLSAFKFKVDISESDIAAVFIGQEASTELNAYENDTFGATVEKIATTATTDSSGNKVFRVTLAFDKPERLKVGLEGDAKLTTTERTNALVVPWESVLLEGDKEYVFKMTEGKAVKAEIKTGIQSETDYEIIEGLSDTDMVILNPSDKLKEGQKVKISNF